LEQIKRKKILEYRGKLVISKDEIKGRTIWTKSRKKLKSFPPCYSKSQIQLCLGIYISSNSRNLLQFLQFSNQELYTIKEKGGKPDRKPYPLSFGLGNPYRNLKSENTQDYAQTPQ
jgi:hypothetical protein